MRRLALVCALLLGPLTGTASATFPGGDGLLAVRPLTGSGVLLVNPGTGHERRICSAGELCDARSPRWSPDGRSLVLSAAGTVGLVYPDGSCLNCAAGNGTAAAFTGNPTLITFVSGGALLENGIDGIRKARPRARGGVTDAAWSAQGRVAIVRGDRLWSQAGAGPPGSLRRIGAGHSPSWSPAGTRVAFVRGAWVMTVRAGQPTTARRLVRGAAPAWSPDGRSIAFVGAGHRLEVIPASGGRSRPIGHGLTGATIDWQPVPSRPAAECLAPAGSRILAQSADAIVTGDDGANGSAFMGCRLADGRERLLERFGPGNVDNAYAVPQAAVAGPYAAFVNAWSDPHYGGADDSVVVFDLTTGALAPGLGGESAQCADYSYSCTIDMDELVLGPDGASAVRTTMLQDGCPRGANTCYTQAIQARDATGSRTLDSATETLAPGAGASPVPVIDNLGLSGNTLTWDHAGAPESAQLG